jgi:hypothetical protein
VGTTRAWEEREVDGRTVRHKRFIDFITAKPRSGCGCRRNEWSS